MNRSPSVQTAADRQNGNGRKIRNDLILLSSVLLIAILAGGVYLLTREPGARAVVSVNGDVFATYPLSRDLTVELPTGADGSHRNLLVIRDGKVSVTEADCRDRICVGHPPISETGETIVCLPNRLVVEIQKEK